MNFKKIVAAVAAAAISVSAMAISAFASTVTLDSEYPGAWGMGASIPKADIEAIGGDVKVVLNIETRNLLSDQFLISPINVVDSWVNLTDVITSDTVVAKQDGWFCIPETATTVEFVLSAATVAELGENGLSFQVQNVTIKSADLSSGSAQGTIPRVSDSEGKDYCFGRLSYADITGTGAAAHAEATEAAPATDAGETTSGGTGNTPAVVMVSVMAVAGMAALTSKKRK